MHTALMAHMSPITKIAGGGSHTTETHRLVLRACRPVHGGSVLDTSIELVWSTYSRVKGFKNASYKFACDTPDLLDTAMWSQTPETIRPVQTALLNAASRNQFTGYGSCNCRINAQKNVDYVNRKPLERITRRTRPPSLQSRMPRNARPEHSGLPINPLFPALNAANHT